MRYDVVMLYESLITDTILFGEKHCKKNGILIFKCFFLWAYGWNQVKFARITIINVCFVALKLAGSLFQHLA